LRWTCLPLASIEKLEVFRGQSSKVVKGVALGSLLGATVGPGVTAAGCSSVAASFGGGGLEDCGRELTIGAFVGAVAGAGIGALIGSGSKIDRWEEVPLERLRVTIVPQRGGELRFGVSVRL
jgi:hypothetical protein